MRYIDYTVDTISIQGCSASTWHVVWSYTEFHQAAEKWAKFAVLYLEQDARDDVSGWLRRPRHPVCRLVPNTCINGDKIKYSQNNNIWQILIEKIYVPVLIALWYVKSRYLLGPRACIPLRETASLSLQLTKHEWSKISN